MALVDRQKEVAGFLTRGFSGRLNLPGWSLVGACAVTGNLTQENLCRPVTTGPLDHGSQGLAQWRLERLTELQAWSSMYFPGGPEAWKTIEAQCAFTLYETARDYKVLDAELRAGTKTIETLTANFCWVFERPSKAHAALDKRIQYARDAYTAMTRAPSIAAKVGTAAGAGTIAAGGVIAALPPSTLTPENLIFGGSLILNALLALVVWLAFRELAKKPAPVAAPQTKWTDALTLAIADRDEAQVRLDEAKQAVSAMVAELQAQIKEAEGILK
jgi:hypothetical protein